MAAEPETLTHPVLGVLTWDAKGRHWDARHELPDGETLDVQVSPGRHDPYAFLKRAADLFGWALANERRVLHEAVEAYLYDLYQGWRQEEDPELSAEEFEGVLGWGLLEISDSELVPV